MTPQSWATLGLMRAAGRAVDQRDPVLLADARTSTADWRAALCIATGIPVDQIDPARGTAPHPTTPEGNTAP